MNDVVILGIETSCDETAAAVVKNGRDVMSNIINSQIDIHKSFGGVVPEVASRKHIENISIVVETALEEANVTYNDLNAVAVTNMPGLVGALLVGISFAKSFAYSINKPLIAINHMHGHIYANFMEHDSIEFPAICLVVSGGHTSLLLMEDINNYKVIGETRDDAAGEAFDKVARFLGLGYPGGPVIQNAAEKGQAGNLKLPRVLLDKNDYEFSFSGLKTATMNMWKKLEKTGGQNVYDLVAEFQAAIVEVLVAKTALAAKKHNAKSILMAGGVAANSQLRNEVQNAANDLGINAYYPSLKLCTDNAAMIAGSAYHDYLNQKFASLKLNAHANIIKL
ncbi:N(6)-L-threonylcarbamoyladenine synthase [Candidatus Syntrophocurvum alkaliphilum]|uniref:tRNA N6-adenosine threonylcarbamoyltransferase n=1 Tax=Candidatus Syntrophocurvum alkaliphilum TaxID=2293317 RepID=A0A6I6D635_9FIRM|nr:tRNA (adenosine(37)-N6)-threonylcarbamoyltransferase complex transferase subunit TsaD [Candidatus Syntrophocurvum alkaliphilum]QGT98753.1 N(6)-L-threonylcarbamoyladenine synthase [Candidatus Syntrophocurvum alkaliphilum]